MRREKWVSLYSPSAISTPSRSLAAEVRVRHCKAFEDPFCRGLASYMLAPIPAADRDAADVAVHSVLQLATKGEEYFAPRVVNILTHYLVPHMCIGQLVLRDRCKADMGILSSEGNTLAVGDCKNTNLDQAVLQTAAYIAQAATSHYKPAEKPILLGVPFTQKQIALYIYLTAPGYYKQIHIGTASWSHARRLLCALKWALSSIPSPARDFHDTPVLFPEWNRNAITVLGANDNVLLYQGEVWKVYDNAQRVAEVLSMMNTISANYLPGARMEHLPPFAALCYPFIPVPAETVPTREHFYELAKQLRCLHSRGIVHGDVRAANVLWTANPSEVKLVDFDFSGPTSKVYPSGFVEPDPLHPVRHPDALPGEQLHPAHDMFSLGILMKQAGYESDPLCVL
eukprot:TRINITY_DN2993_c0_g1_i1.p1 TRINITY_DN2993_c0_g1~~TRINITY_DN2993_c0_g1_i1.p1  ORF type:complete len:424 (-),score=26.00 TRINITY_DN2993_c0_g1_i1:17-1210(-)